MIRLDLSSAPKWLDLGHGLRLHVLPVTTAIMVRKFNEQMASGDRPGPEDQIRSIRSR